jgi:hypothetical protein
VGNSNLAGKGGKPKRGSQSKQVFTIKKLSNHEILTLAVFLLGGESKCVDSEDIAVKVNEIAPGRYVWKKYPSQINLEIVRVYLSDAKKLEKGGYLIGSGTKGWFLTEKGLEFAKNNISALKKSDLAREPLTQKEKIWRKTEKARIMVSDAFLKYQSTGPDSVTIEEIETMFHVGPYILGRAREIKMLRILNTFGSDAEIGQAVCELGHRLKDTGK